MKVALSCIVEGHGDAAALPVLLRRMTERMIPGAVLDLGCVLRIPRTRLIKPGELERAVELAARKSAGCVFRRFRTPIPDEAGHHSERFRTLFRGFRTVSG